MGPGTSQSCYKCPEISGRNPAHLSSKLKSLQSKNDKPKLCALSLSLFYPSLSLYGIVSRESAVLSKFLKHRIDFCEMNSVWVLRAEFNQTFWSFSGQSEIPLFITLNCVDNKDLKFFILSFLHSILIFYRIFTNFWTKSDEIFKIFLSFFMI